MKEEKEQKTIKITREIDGNKLELFMIAIYLCGYSAAQEQKTITHPDIRESWRRMKELLYKDLEINQTK